MKNEFQFLTAEEELTFVKLQLSLGPLGKRRCQFFLPVPKKVCTAYSPVKTEDLNYPDSALPPSINSKKSEGKTAAPKKKKISQPQKPKKPRRKSKPRPVLQHETKRANQVTLACAHCGVQFSAKATYRKRFGHYLVNHACSGKKRTQFVIGRKHKRCTFGCAAALGCIRFVLC